MLAILAILGTGGKMFNEDARKSIARAIQEAEQEQNKGLLKLTIRRAKRHRPHWIAGMSKSCTAPSRRPACTAVRFVAVDFPRQLRPGPIPVIFSSDYPRSGKQARFL